MDNQNPITLVKTMNDETKCLMWKEGMCNSDYTKGIKCDGINIPDECSYKNGGSFAMAVKDAPNRRKDSKWD